jgi:hypothetical protein
MSLLFEDFLAVVAHHQREAAWRATRLDFSHQNGENRSIKCDNTKSERFPSFSDEWETFTFSKPSHLTIKTSSCMAEHSFRSRMIMMPAGGAMLLALRVDHSPLSFFTSFYQIFNLELVLVDSAPRARRVLMAGWRVCTALQHTHHGVCSIALQQCICQHFHLFRVAGLLHWKYYSGLIFVCSESRVGIANNGEKQKQKNDEPSLSHPFWSRSLRISTAASTDCRNNYFAR